MTKSLTTSTMTIEIDTHEKKPYRFRFVRPAIPFTTVARGLPTADYRVNHYCNPSGHSDLKYPSQAVVERKTLSDLYRTVTRERKRFVAELVRMKEYGFAALVVEAEWTSILCPNRTLVHPTKYRPKAMLASLLAWGQRYRVHVFTCPGRDAGELVTYRLLERWFRDAQAGKRD